MLCSSLQHAAAWKHLASLSVIMNQSLVSVTEHGSTAVCFHDLARDTACKEGEAELRSRPCAPCTPPYGAIIQHTANQTAHTAPYGPYAYGNIILERFHTDFEGPMHHASAAYASCKLSPLRWAARFTSAPAIGAIGPVSIISVHGETRIEHGHYIIRE